MKIRADIHTSVRRRKQAGFLNHAAGKTRASHWVSSTFKHKTLHNPKVHRVAKFVHISGSGRKEGGSITVNWTREHQDSTIQLNQDQLTPGLLFL